ncbi:hypothetical protein ZIOFF_070259 [Zingiber officinale]|uniref:BSD domain-containing protein n=1 Tax=Zingiber officinale TaxID=94328 RepID=A0A8J5CWK8_ZINOF|nr:hypothetical protein ZIOFF_070259 [Zingiber officinale]
MDLWQMAKGFAEEAAKRSQEISKEAARRSQELTVGAARFSQEFVSETAKKSKEIAAEAAKGADLIRSEALRAADQIKTLAVSMPVPSIPSTLIQESDVAAPPQLESELEKFGITKELREFVRGITIDTFRDFPMQGASKILSFSSRVLFSGRYQVSILPEFTTVISLDEPEMSDTPTVSNVRQDLNEWQARHAALLLSTVEVISKFRYELCPRYMKERKFWRIYFIIVNNHVAP